MLSLYLLNYIFSSNFIVDFKFELMPIKIKEVDDLDSHEKIVIDNPIQNIKNLSPKAQIFFLPDVIEQFVCLPKIFTYSTRENLFTYFTKITYNK